MSPQLSDELRQHLARTLAENYGQPQASEITASVDRLQQDVSAVLKLSCVTLGSSLALSEPPWPHHIRKPESTGSPTNTYVSLLGFSLLPSTSPTPSSPLLPSLWGAGRSLRQEAMSSPCLPKPELFSAAEQGGLGKHKPLWSSGLCPPWRRLRKSLIGARVVAQTVGHLPCMR